MDYDGICNSNCNWLSQLCVKVVSVRNQYFYKLKDSTENIATPGLVEPGLLFHVFCCFYCMLKTCF